MRRVLRAIAALVGLLVTVTLIGGVAFYLWLSGTFDRIGGATPRADDPALEETGPETLRIPLLQAEGFDPSAPGAALVLHPLATGFDTPVIISDPALLSAAAETAYFTDYRRRDLELVVLSALFLQPPTGRVNDRFATLFMDGHEVETRTCNIALCSSPDHDRDLAGLPRMGVPMTVARETVSGLAEARAREAEIRAQPNHVLIRGVADIRGVSGRFDGYAVLELPSFFGSIDPPRDHDFDAERDAFELAVWRFADSLPFDVSIEEARLPTRSQRLRIVSRLTGDSEFSMRGRVEQATPTVQLWTEEANLPALAAEIARYDWPVFGSALSEDEVAAWLAATVEAEDLPLAPHRYRVEQNEAARVTAPRLSAYEHPQIDLRYYRPIQ